MAHAPILSLVASSLDDMAITGRWQLCCDADLPRRGYVVLKLSPLMLALSNGQPSGESRPVLHSHRVTHTSVLTTVTLFGELGVIELMLAPLPIHASMYTLQQRPTQRFHPLVPDRTDFGH